MSSQPKHIKQQRKDAAETEEARRKLIRVNEAEIIPDTATPRYLDMMFHGFWRAEQAQALNVAALTRKRYAEAKLDSDFSHVLNSTVKKMMGVPVEFGRRTAKTFDELVDLHGAPPPRQVKTLRRSSLNAVAWASETGQILDRPAEAYSYKLDKMVPVGKQPFKLP